jgi:hypothetical protein
LTLIIRLIGDKLGLPEFPQDKPSTNVYCEVVEAWLKVVTVVGPAAMVGDAEIPPIIDSLEVVLADFGCGWEKKPPTCHSGTLGPGS